MDYYARGLRVEAGQNLYFLGQLKMEGLQEDHIILGRVPNKGARNQVHYTKNKNAKKIENVRVPSDVAKGSMIFAIPAIYPPPPGTDTYKVGYGIAHDAGGGGHNPTLYLPDRIYRPILIKAIKG